MYTHIVVYKIAAVVVVSTAIDWVWIARSVSVRGI